jgi:CcmD family protein
MQSRNPSGVRRKAVWGSGRRVLGVLLILLLFGLVAGRAAAEQQQPPPKTPSVEGFVPVDQLPPQEQLPAVPLVIAAYALAWLAIFVYLWSLWRRLGRVERDIADVTRRLPAEGRR